MKPIFFFKGIKSFRLGYAEQRPYPWRWTTPIVLCAFFLICPFLAAINVPLSAYNIVQEATYRPNDSLQSLPLSNILPSILQNPAGDFAPQLLTVGDVLILNNSIFNHTISEAFNSPDLATPISSFPYYNNPLSDNCDVTNITLNLVVTNSKTGYENIWKSQPQLSGSVTCRKPTPFYLTWSGLPPYADDTLEDIRYLPFLIRLDLFNLFEKWTGPSFDDLAGNYSEVDISLTAHPCCDCAAVLAGSALETTSLLQPPCSSNPVQFIAIDAPGSTPISIDPIGNIFSSPIRMPVNITHLLWEGQFSNITQDIEDFSAILQNLFQVMYYLVRLDLGVILGNQIYNSPQMFNHSIAGINSASTVHFVFAGMEFGWATDIARGATSNTSMMAQWKKKVEFFNTSDRVPVMECVRSIPRIKPLGSAITSVFVSIFAMLSVLWTIFSVIAGALAAAHNAPTHGTGHYTTGHGGCTMKELDNGKAIMEEMNTSEGSLLAHHTECVPAWHVPLERMNLHMEEMQLNMEKIGRRTDIALARMMFSLRKRGLVDDKDDKDGESEMEIECAQRPAESPVEIFSPLIHRTSTQSGSDSDWLI
ncbi:hypothetical protein K438DRAFT_1836627 [Mycena galopus ATCC 62051]|nr:hypothetical protein K438DRAFT_1836627 [Mycena galopus ATCC 62051]